MRTSVLSPRIFARLLRNEPIVYRECLYRRASQIRAYHGRTRHILSSRGPHTGQQRTLFGWISPVPKEAYLATGEKAALAYLKDACTRIDNQVRPPPTDDLAKAWSTFVRERASRRGRFNDAEANYVGRVLELLKETEEGRLQELVGNEGLWHALESLKPEEGRRVDGEGEVGKAYVMLSRLLFEETRARMTAEKVDAFWDGKVKELWLKHIAVMATYGLSEHARDLMAESDLSPEMAEEVWPAFLIKLAEQKSPLQGANQIPAVIEKQIKSTLTADLKRSLSAYYASVGDLASAKQYFTFDVETGSDSNQLGNWYIEALLRACREHNDLAWGREIIKAVTSNAEAMKTQKHLWNLTFGWALSTGKSVDEISRMMDVMVKTNKEFMPTTSDINAMIVIANEKSDPYLAERLITLGDKWGCRPDELTYLLQMDYRLSIGDVDGARSAFDMVKSSHDSSGDNDTGARVNRLIQAMCSRKSGSYSFDTIMDTVDFLGERASRFEAATVAALSTLHLQRDEYNDVADLLSTNAKDFSLTERAVVRQAILNLMLGPVEEMPLQRLWDTYMIFQHVFEEAPREDRIAIMAAFFDRGRPDMAIHVFNHMRRHRSPHVNPDTETYVAALMGCGRNMDSEGLAVVNNVLKLDIHVAETTRLHNARMIAFFGTGESEKAQAVWEDVVRSEEGPSRNSLLCVFRVCEQSDFGEVRAREVWRLLRRMDVGLDSEVVAAYVGALAGNGCEEEARRVVETSGRELGVEVDEMILAKLFNGCVTTVRQNEVERWIEERFPIIWTRLKTKCFSLRLNDTRALPMDVRMEP